MAVPVWEYVIGGSASDLGVLVVPHCTLLLMLLLLCCLLVPLAGARGEAAAAMATAEPAIPAAVPARSRPRSSAAGRCHWGERAK